jgi:hypothetical protein
MRFITSRAFKARRIGSRVDRGPRLCTCMSAIAVPCYDGGHGSAFFLEAELTGVLGCLISTSFESADPRYDGWRGFAFLGRPG